MITTSVAAALRLIKIDRLEKMARRSVPGKTGQGEMYHSLLNGQSAWSPYGRLASAPNQSSRMCEPKAAVHAHVAPHRIRPVTHLVTPAAIIITSAIVVTLCVAV